MYDETICAEYGDHCETCRFISRCSGEDTDDYYNQAPDGGYDIS